ncbi:hypothetical protein D1627_06450 [Pontibacter oryzae]|uniref:Uncharacterized protein n=1 Tax=Pontibacter oryzae TaxID=2304593 RepID=A0A399SF88_9BACT|nr:hypothetical protein D1627_06450 [Pontibacter oryzae]
MPYLEKKLEIFTDLITFLNQWRNKVWLKVENLIFTKQKTTPILESFFVSALSFLAFSISKSDLIAISSTVIITVLHMTVLPFLKLHLF